MYYHGTEEQALSGVMENPDCRQLDLLKPHGKSCGEKSLRITLRTIRCMMCNDLGVIFFPSSFKTHHKRSAKFTGNRGWSITKFVLVAFYDEEEREILY